MEADVVAATKMTTSYVAQFLAHWHIQTAEWLDPLLDGTVLLAVITLIALFICFLLPRSKPPRLYTRPLDHTTITVLNTRPHSVTLCRLRGAQQDLIATIAAFNGYHHCDVLPGSILLLKAGEELLLRTRITQPKTHWQVRKHCPGVLFIEHMVCD